MSSAAESRAQRQAALEERRRRIASLREARTQRAEDTARVQQQHQNLDEYVTGLLKEPAPGAAAAMDAMPTLVTEETAADAAAATAAAIDKAAMATTTAMAQSDNVVAQAVAPAPPPPKQVETFTIGTQTEEEDFVEEMTQTDEREEDEEEEEETTKDKDDDKESSKAKKSLQQAAENENKRKKQQQQQEQENGEPKILTSHELEKEVSSQPFSTFINTASKKVERMLGTPLLSDLLVDYVGATDGDDDDEITAAASKREAAAAATSNKYLQDRQIYSCPKWTAGREVTNLDWSPLHRELFLSTHHVAVSISADAAAKTSSSSSSSSISTTAITAIGPHHTYDTPSASLTPRSGELQSDGLALIWSLSMPQRPEHVFTCGSPVTTGRFHPTDAKLVVGGCASGQIVVWDVRAGRLPVQKSALVVVTGKSSSSSQQHTHPIGTMEVLEGGAGFVTSSTDGKVNFWSLSNLREPAESLQLGDSVSCLAVAPESGTLVLGDENGSLYAATATSGKRRQVRKFDTGEGGGHYGMVTALSTKRLKTGAPNRAAGLAKGFLRGSGGLVLSAGVDWTVQLWAPAYKDTPLTSLVSHSYDYMSDVKWSPSHPSLFATASSNGSVGLWNLSTSLDEPITNVVVEPDSSRGLNRLSWSLDGRRLAAASSDQVHLLNLTEEAIRTKGDEDAKSMMNHFMARGWISRQ